MDFKQYETEVGVINNSILLTEIDYAKSRFLR